MPPPIPSIWKKIDPINKEQLDLLYANPPNYWECDCITDYDKIGETKAGTATIINTIEIWNNKDGSSAVSDMTNVEITTKDTTGGNTGNPLVYDKWAEKYSAGSYIPFGGNITSNVTSPISGTINGTYQNFQFRFNPPANAIPGHFYYRMRVYYSF